MNPRRNINCNDPDINGSRLALRLVLKSGSQSVHSTLQGPIISNTLLTPQQLEPAVELTTQALAQMDAILLGQQDLHRMVLAGVLSGGHILLEGLPGVGKTALIKALGQVLNLQFSRVQFTPDLMPGDII